MKQPPACNAKKPDVDLCQQPGQTRKGMLIIVSGPSGTGKGTLCERLLASAAAR